MKILGGQFRLLIGAILLLPRLALAQADALPSWNDGAAKQAYQGVQQQWDQLNQTMNQALQGMGTGVQTAHDNFTAAEQRNTSVWST